MALVMWLISLLALFNTLREQIALVVGFFLGIILSIISIFLSRNTMFPVCPNTFCRVPFPHQQTMSSAWAGFCLCYLHCCVLSPRSSSQYLAHSVHSEIFAWTTTSLEYSNRKKKSNTVIRPEFTYLYFKYLSSKHSYLCFFLVPLIDG